MIGPDHPLAELQALAALTSRWPTVQVRARSEAEAVAAADAACACLGPLPQLEVVEPWDPADPTEPWEVRAVVPGLTPGGWAALRTALGGHAPDLVPGPGPGRQEALDLGLAERIAIAAGGVTATAFVDHAGDFLGLDLARAAGADDAIRSLELELIAAVRSVRADLGPASDLGPDRVQPVVHRATGRFGVEITVPDALPHREAVVAAVGAVVRARREHPTARLAPDLWWSGRLDALRLVAWFVAPPVDGLPVAGVAPGIGRVPPGWTDDAGRQLGAAELQVVPADPGRCDEVALRVAARLADLEAAAEGAPARWLVGPGGWAFCPTWRVAPGSLALEELADPDIAAIRLVPGEPPDEADRWPHLDPTWFPTPLRTFTRLRDGLTDRDHLEPATPRPPTPRDAAVELLALAALAASPDAAGLVPALHGISRPIDGPSGAGLELSFDRSSFVARRLWATLAALGAVEHPALSCLATWAHTQDRTVVRLWLRPT